MKIFGGTNVMLLSGIKTSDILKYVGNVFKRKISFSFWLLLEQAQKLMLKHLPIET